MFEGEKQLSEQFEVWYEASKKRYSCRNYKKQPIADDDQSKIVNLCNLVNGFDDGVRFVPIFNASPDMFGAAPFMALKNVPAFVAIFSNRESRAFEQAGFYGEAVCLDMTRLGINTCWVSGSIKRQKLSEYMDIKGTERFLTSIAFGYGCDSQEKVLQKTTERKRKSIEKVFKVNQENNNWQRIMRCVIDAPSAMNRQPWRFEMSDDMILAHKPLIRGGSYPAELDVGIAMLHLSIAVRTSGIIGEWHLCDGHIGKFLID